MVRDGFWGVFGGASRGVVVLDHTDGPSPRGRSVGKFVINDSCDCFDRLSAAVITMLFIYLTNSIVNFLPF